MEDNPSEGPDLRDPPPWEWWDAPLIYLLWALLQVPVVFAIAAGGVDLLEADPVTASAITATALALLLVVTLVWIRLRSRAATGSARPGLRRLIGVRPWTWADVLAGVVHGAIGFVAINFVYARLVELLADRLERELPPVQEAVQEAAASDAALPLLLLGAVAFAAVAEELLFRGVLFQALRKRLALWPAMVLSAIAFAAYHLEPLVIVLILPLGVYFAWLTHRRGTVVTAMVAHGVFNLAGVLLIRTGVG